jgi:hypothetical protein
MAGSRDSSEVSPSNIIELTWETLPADEQLQFEEHKEQMIQEAKARFLVSGTIIRGTLKTPNSQLVTPISIKLQRPDGYD